MQLWYFFKTLINLSSPTSHEKSSQTKARALFQRMLEHNVGAYFVLKVKFNGKKNIPKNNPAVVPYVRL